MWIVKKEAQEAAALAAAAAAAEAAAAKEDDDNLDAEAKEEGEAPVNIEVAPTPVEQPGIVEPLSNFILFFV